MYWQPATRNPSDFTTKRFKNVAACRSKGTVLVFPSYLRHRNHFITLGIRRALLVRMQPKPPNSTARPARVGRRVREAAVRPTTGWTSTRTPVWVIEMADDMYSRRIRIAATV